MTKNTNLISAQAQSAQREIYFFVYREIPMDENDPCENLTAQNILVCRYLPTNKNFSLCALCLVVSRLMDLGSFSPSSIGEVLDGIDTNEV